MISTVSKAAGSAGGRLLPGLPRFGSHPAGFAQADDACVPNATAGAMPAVVPDGAQTPRRGVWNDNDAAVFLGNLIPHDVLGELPPDIADKVMPKLACERIKIFGALQELDSAGKIAPVLAGKCVDIPRSSQEQDPR